MDNHVSHENDRRSIATENGLDSVVERLVERGVIRPEEADDMHALLSAVSDLSSVSQAMKSNRDWLQRGAVRRRKATAPRS